MSHKSAHIKGLSLRRKKKAKLIECVSRENYRGSRDVLMEVSDMAGKPKPRKKASRLPRAERKLHNDTLHLETPPQPMDIDETFWVDSEEPIMPISEKKVSSQLSLPQRASRISQSQHTYVEDFIPKIGPYLRCLLDSEGVPLTTTCQSCKSAPFEWRCSDCFPALVLCKECCRKSHRQLPFHMVQKWMGKYFAPSWLREVGVCLQFGHSGDPCPYRTVRHKAFMF